MTFCISFLFLNTSATVFENEVVDVNNPPAAQVAFIVTGPE